LTRAHIASRGEGFLLSWQRRNGPAGRDVALGRRAVVWLSAVRAGRALRLCLGALLLASAMAAPAEQPYALIGRPAPDFALRAVAGDNVRLSEHRGEVVVVSFWSSRCTPCRTQLAALNRSFATYASAGLSIYGVGVDDDPAQALDFAHSAAVRFAMLLDPAKGVSRSYQVDNLPMTVLIDRNGTVRYLLRDYSDASNTRYLQELRTLLNE
jgi:peroxiredoxin